MKWDFRDFFILGHVNAAGIVGTVFLYKYPTSDDFMAWCGLIATLVGFYHYFVLRDSKIPDAP